MKLLAAVSLVLLASAAQAALPPPSAEDQAKAAEAKARAAWSNKVAAYQLCAVQDRVAAQYLDRLRAEGKAAPQPIATGACADPGPFVYAPTPSVQPREGAGAHSPAETAVNPPSSTQTEAEGKPAK